MMEVVGQKSPGPPTAAGLVTPHLSKRGLRAGGLSPRASAGVPRVWGHRGLSMGEREKLEQCSQHRECVWLSLCRIMKWFCWEETLKILQFHSLPWAGSPCTRPGYPGPAQPSVTSSHRNSGVSVPAQAQSWLCKMEFPLQCFSFPVPEPCWPRQAGSARAGSDRALPSLRGRCLPGAGPPVPRGLPGASGGLAAARASLPQETRLKIPGQGSGKCCTRGA